jgi:hypothetical protein
LAVLCEIVAHVVATDGNRLPNHRSADAVLQSCGL